MGNQNRASRRATSTPPQLAASRPRQQHAPDMEEDTHWDLPQRARKARAQPSCRSAIGAGTSVHLTRLAGHCDELRPADNLIGPIGASSPMRAFRVLALAAARPRSIETAGAVAPRRRSADAWCVRYCVRSLRRPASRGGNPGRVRELPEGKAALPRFSQPLLLSLISVRSVVQLYPGPFDDLFLAPPQAVARISFLCAGSAR